MECYQKQPKLVYAAAGTGVCGKAPSIPLYFLYALQRKKKIQYVRTLYPLYTFFPSLSSKYYEQFENIQFGRMHILSLKKKLEKRKRRRDRERERERGGDEKKALVPLIENMQKKQKQKKAHMPHDCTMCVCARAYCIAEGK